MSGTIMHERAVPLVSIVIPTYNQSRYLTEAIQSALGQTWDNIEVIVVDNGSTDSTAAVLESFGSQIKCIHQENLGPSSARNRGVKEAAGEFVVFLDGDDILLADCVEARVTLLQSTNHGLVVGSFFIVDAERNHLWSESLSLQQNHTVSLENMLAQMFGPTCGLTVRKASFDAIGGFDDSLHIAEDSDFVLRMTAHKGSSYDSEPRAEYRQAGTSLSRNYLLLFDSYWRMARKNVDLLPDKQRYWAIVRPSMQDRLANLIFGKLLKERGLRAIPLFLGLFFRRPSTLPCFFYWMKRAMRKRIPGTANHIKQL